jgi:hypothetical protein
MDTVGWYIATLHQILGHRTAARVLGQEVIEGEQADCILCRYENGTATREEVERQIGGQQ